MASHVALLLCLALVFHETRQRESTAADRPAMTQLVWMPGGGGGGGGGGNQNSEPARRLQRSGTDRLSTPAVRASLTEFQKSAAAENELAIMVPAVALASETLTLPGALNNRSFSIDSLGPGSRGGAETGNNGGIGSGDGLGTGPGQRENVGGGEPAGPGAKLVMPTVIRSVKPEYTTEAMRAHVQGVVLVRAIVQADGTVRDVRVVRSLDPVFGLDQAAVRAATQWLFRPALMAGQPVALAISIELVFSLR